MAVGSNVVIFSHTNRDLQAGQLEPLARLGAKVFTLEPERWGDAAVPGGTRAILIQPEFMAKVEVVRAAIAKLRLRFPGMHIGLLDSTDSTASPMMQLAGEVDSYLKKQLLADRSMYQSDFAGGYHFADWGLREREWTLGDWHFGSIVAAGDLDKLKLGWSLGAMSAHAKAFRWSQWRERFGLLKPCAKRSIDVICISQTSPGDVGTFYTKHREEMVEQLSAMAGRKVVAATYARGSKPLMTKRHYNAAMRDAKICVSPFGWGEICHRDFEAIIAGCVLVKPDMGVIESEPEIYRVGETFVPCRWDGSDLAEVCARLLDDPQRAQAIVDCARDAYMDYFAKGGAVPRARAYLASLTSAFAR